MNDLCRYYKSCQPKPCTTAIWGGQDYNIRQLLLIYIQTILVTQHQVHKTKW